MPEAQAYSVLVDAMENGTCAATLLPAVPALPAMGTALALLGLMTSIGGAQALRSRPRSRGRTSPD